MKIKRTYQQRLAMKQDLIRRKLIDNMIEHIGEATDCIRIHLTKNQEGDIESRVIEKADIVPIVFPNLENIPYRRLKKNKYQGYTLTSLVNSADDSLKQNYEIIATYDSFLTTEDLIVRVFMDPDIPDPIILVLEVLEQLGTFGGEMIIQSKYQTQLYSEPLNTKTLEVIAEMAKRRLYLNF